MNINIEDLPKIVLPVIPLRGISIFPHMVTHFDIGRERSIKAFENAMIKDEKILLTSQIDPKIENPTKDDFYQVGTIAEIKQMLKLPDGNIRVLVKGISRGKILSYISEESFIEAQVVEVSNNDTKIKEDDLEIHASKRLLLKDLDRYISLNPKLTPEVLLSISDIDSPGDLVDTICSYINLKPEENQIILQTFDELERLNKMHRILKKEIELLEIEAKIDRRVKKQMSEVQKEYFLREQMKAIKEELGESEDIEGEAEEYRQKIKKLNLNKKVEEKVLKEVNRLEKISPHSPENGVIKTYLDWIVDLPWNKESKDNLDINKSREILNKDHYGLEDVKERILEFIAVRQFTNSMKGPILCLVGPPGVGKTSIARSVAASMNREFVRMSLGGVTDESEIRGHRRTYVGSMPGRIINSMKDAGTKNPVFLFDEIDKLGSDFRGDPSSALLEVLDPEQNNTFKDHYLDIPFDLSKVLFMTTANSLNTIPAPLLDRMEIIEINSYTEEEKLEIAKRHLVPKQIKEHGLTNETFNISDQAILTIIQNYTREAGVRNLERQISNLCRKAVKRIIEEDKDKIRININSLERYLGTPRYIKNIEDTKENKVGVVTGLAWTAVGGETLSIEVNIVEGKGEIQLTGKLGDVMKESAMAAISYIRSNYNKFKIDRDFYKNKDIHIHVPEGAVPKDGPSAGISMATAVISALTNIKVRSDVAMTGEITLRGRVLPVGGIKEKVLAANRLGIRKVILPYDSKKELNEVPSVVKNSLEFILVKNMEDVLTNSLERGFDQNEF